jgi:hypothetical protein
MDAAPPFVCECRIERGRIAFCPTHREAARLVSACDYIRKLLPTLKLAESGQANMIRDVVLPYLDAVIPAAQK